MKRVRRCANCAGTGKLVLMKSWFPADGYRRTTCGICGGTGRSSYQPAPDVVRQNRELREAFAKPPEAHAHRDAQR